MNLLGGLGGGLPTGNAPAPAPAQPNQGPGNPITQTTHTATFNINSATARVNNIQPNEVVGMNS